MGRRLKVELFEEIRRGHAAGEMIKGLAKKHGVHRRMVRQAIANAIPLKTLARYLTRYRRKQTSENQKPEWVAVEVLRRSPEVTHYVVHNIMTSMLSTGLC